MTDLYRRLEGGDGYVYVLENPAQPGICKIGSTGRTPGERLKEINAGSGVIYPWRVATAFRCKAPLTVEKIVHRELNSVRVRSNKEGFEISVEEAEKAIQQVINSNTIDFKLN